MIPLIDRAADHAERLALVTPDGSFTYRQLLQQSGQIASQLLNGAADLQEQRVAFLVPAGFDYVAVQWGIWRAGGIAVPLCLSHPRPELEYVITDAAASIAIVHPSFAPLLGPIAQARPLRLLFTAELTSAAGLEIDPPPEVPLPEVPLPEVPPPEVPLPEIPLPNIALDRRALILYTSGTTGKPKGVVTTHGNIQAQVTSLVTAWGWTEQDRVLHVLPLHHIHGIVNVLTCALWAGAECHMLGKFDAEAVWDRIAAADLTLFMAVPTIYSKLIAAWEQTSPERQAVLSQGCRAMRLMVSGSAALPLQVLDQWQQISGHFLLERYGMTEIGMALSNPLHGSRRAGFVGTPLPQVEVRLVDEQGQPVPPGVPGEIQVQGPGVFGEYWQKPAATAEAFQEGWFRTGDLALVEQDCYRILGRLSVDIIKTGGYKVSALEIEDVLRTHPAIQDCAVVGVSDPDWGERVCAALVLQPGQDLALDSFRSWAKQQLAVYKVPTRILPVTDLPRNAMGKVTKPAVAELFRA